MLLWKFRAVPHKNFILKNAHFISTEHCNIRSSGILQGIGWYLVTDVSGQSIGRIFQGSSSLWPLKCPTDTSSQNVYDQLPTYAAQDPKRPKPSTTQQRKLEVSRQKYVKTCYLTEIEELVLGYDVAGRTRIADSSTKPLWKAQNFFLIWLILRRYFSVKWYKNKDNSSRINVRGK